MTKLEKKYDELEEFWSPAVFFGKLSNVFCLSKKKLMTSRVFLIEYYLGEGIMLPPEGNMSEPNEIASH